MTFLEKATQSLESAKCLVKQSYYSSTVNRSYYACLQYILHVLFEKIKMDQTGFEQDLKQKQHIGTHSYATKIIGNELARKDISDYKWFQKQFPELKEKRITADYHSVVISADEGNASILRAETIINLLKKHFK